MSEEKKHIVYSAADIQKYLSGDMNISEMYAIEKAALDDPLLAEAIEGYEGMKQKDWSKQLTALKDKLETKENTPVIPVYSFRKWWRKAAAVLIITIGVAITYLFNSKEQKSFPAIANVPALDSAAIAKTDSSIAINSNNSPVDRVIKDNQATISATSTEAQAGRRNKKLPAETKKENKKDNDFIYQPSVNPVLENNNKDIAATSNRIDDSHKNNAAPVIINKENNSNSQLNQGFADKSLSLQNQANNSVNNYINAQVVTAEDKPVAFANVSVQKNKPSVYTDAKGNFNVPTTDSVLSVVVTSAGYIPKTYSIKASAKENKIILQQDTIGITAINSARSKSAARPQLRKEIENADTTGEDAEPAIGWDGYNNYINENLVFPNEAREKNIHGVVEVFVKLKENGDISQIKVNKPLCPECDAEAVRLVKEGPKWEVKNNKAKKAKVKIRF